MVVACALAGCGRVGTPPTAPDTRCVVVAIDGAATGPLTLGLSAPVNPARAPVGAGEADRLLFRQLYETLVSRSCDGTLLPGLASAWTPEAGGRRWHVTLRDDARFWDGRPLTADAVVAAWTAAAVPGLAASALDTRRLVVALPRAVAAPEILADPALAIVWRAVEGEWPLGTTPPGRLRHVTGTDGRDLLDRGVDLLVTGDPQVIAYARGLPEYEERPLPWDRVYVVRAAAVPRGRRAGAFEHAVRAVARAPAPPYWWQTLDGCPLPRLPPRRGDGAVTYAAGDATAAELAARIVAMGGASWRAVPMNDARAATATVVAVPVRPFRPCATARALGLETTAVPLVETRRVLLVRRDRRVTVQLDWDGMPRIVWRER